MRALAFSVGFSLLCALSSPVHAAINVDGSMGDWGIGTSNGSLTYTGASGIQNYSTGTGFLPDPNPYPNLTSNVANFLGMGATLYYQSEDKVGSNGFVGPMYGGQDYDVEFLGVIIQNGKLYIGIASGQRPDNGFSNYSPGDIRLTINGTLFGIEVGGGRGGNGGSLVELGATGATYGLNSSGHTDGYRGSNGSTYGSNPPVDFDDDQTAGSIWKPTNWYTDSSFPSGNGSQFQIIAGTPVGQSADYAFSRDSVSTQHSFIEVEVNLSTFLTSLGKSSVNEIQVQSVEWSPSCRNDVLHVDIPEGSGGTEEIPEPISIAIWSAMTLVGAVAFRRRTRA